MNTKQLYEWTRGDKNNLPEISYEDYPPQYLVRIKGDDPRSGWVGTFYATAEKMNEIITDYWEWLRPVTEVTNEWISVKDKNRLPKKFKNINQRRNQRAFSEGAEYGYSLAQSEIKQLEQWKREAIAVMPDYQAIGKVLNIKLGESVHDKILPGIEALRERIWRLEKYLSDYDKDYAKKHNIV